MERSIDLSRLEESAIIAGQQADTSEKSQEFLDFLERQIELEQLEAEAIVRNRIGD